MACLLSKLCLVECGNKNLVSGILQNTKYYENVMKGNSLSNCLPIFIFSAYLSIVSSQPRGDGEEERKKIGCQQRSTSGRSYAGEANTTVDGIPCQRWTDTQPHNHSYTYVGDHNFCRNPSYWDSQVWCYTTDPEVRYQYCSVPFCPPLILKVLDFSLDNALCGYP